MSGGFHDLFLAVLMTLVVLRGADAVLGIKQIGCVLHENVVE